MIKRMKEGTHKEREGKRTDRQKEVNKGQTNRQTYNLPDVSKKKKR